LEEPILQKIKAVARICYNAKDILLKGDVEQRISKFTEWGYQNLPVCIAKTHLSISHDPSVKKVPQEYLFPINDIKLSAGAGYIYPIAGDINLMPGLPRRPNLEKLDIDGKGNILGLV
jgi:formyltetrahydrofolate synthetase